MSWMETHVNYSSIAKFRPWIPLDQTCRLVAFTRAKELHHTSVRVGSLATSSYTDVSPGFPRAIEYPTSLGFVESGHFCNASTVCTRLLNATSVWRSTKAAGLRSSTNNLDVGVCATFPFRSKKSLLVIAWRNILRRTDSETPVFLLKSS